MTPLSLREIREQNDMARRGREAMKQDIADLCRVVEQMAAALGHWQLAYSGIADDIPSAIDLMYYADRDTKGVLSLVKRET